MYGGWCAPQLRSRSSRPTFADCGHPDEPTAWFFAISALLIIPGIVSLALFGLRPGIDFTGGSLLRYQVSDHARPGDIQRVFMEAGIHEVQVQSTVSHNGAPSVIVRAPARDINHVEQAEAGLRSTLGEVTRESIDTVGPLVGEQTTRNAVLAVSAASGIILGYIWWAFRRVDRAWRYGACAVVALLHDALLVLGLWSMLGVLLVFEIDALFVTGILTVVGFSVHDTVVVFDRIRENLSRRAAATFEQTVNNSLVQTLVRSLNTSLTVLFTLLAWPCSVVPRSGILCSCCWWAC